MAEQIDGLESPAQGVTDKTGVTQSGAQPDAQQKLFDASDADKFKAENAELRAQLSKLQKAQQEADEKRLSEQGKWQELAEKRHQESLELKGQLTNMRKQSALQEAAQEMGLRSMRYLKLIDRDALEVGDDGSVNGAREALAKLKEEDASLFGDAVKQNSVRTPSAITPGGQRSIDPSKVYTAEQIQSMSDEEFVAYRKAKQKQTDPFMG